MKLSELFFAKTKELWDEAANKPFVIEMAKGTLDADLFKRYMLQDYLYLQDYIAILKDIWEIAENVKIKAFLKRIIDGTVDETERVHVANMKELGITADDIARSVKFPVINAYVEYMRECTDRFGLTGGITSLLQCSWVYAYIAEIRFVVFSARSTSTRPSFVIFWTLLLLAFSSFSAITYLRQL